MMKKMFMITALMLAVSVFATDYASIDKAIPVSKSVTQTMAKTRVSKPYLLNVWGAIPDNGTVTISYVHRAAGGLLITNSLPAITLVSGAVSTNIASLVKVPIFKGEAVTVKFSTATNGVLQLIGELYGD